MSSVLEKKHNTLIIYMIKTNFIKPVYILLALGKIKYITEQLEFQKT